MVTFFPTPNLPITTAEQAINKGDSFLTRYFLVRKSVSVRQEGEQWKVSLDVTIFGPKETVFLTIDTHTGAITEFSRETEDST